MMRYQRAAAIASLAVVFAVGCGSGTDDGAAIVADTPTPSLTSASPTPASAEKSPIDGGYTMTLTRHDVVAAGFRAGMVSNIAGVWRVTFSFEYAQQFVNLGGITADGYQGSFSVDGDRLTLTDAPMLAFDWRLEGKQLSLTLVDESSADPVDALIWTAHPWERTGD